MEKQVADTQAVKNKTEIFSVIEEIQTHKKTNIENIKSGMKAEFSSHSLFTFFLLISLITIFISSSMSRETFNSLLTLLFILSFSVLLSTFLTYSLRISHLKKKEFKIKKNILKGSYFNTKKK